MKTIEQEKKEFITSFCGDDIKYGHAAAVGFDKGVEVSQRWISVEEELPEDNTYVLAKTKYDYLVAYFDKGFWSRHGAAFYINNVLFWRPIELK